MTLADGVHGTLMYPRRVRALADHAARLIPPNARVLDVGTGDGQIAAALLERRPDVQVQVQVQVERAGRDRRSRADNYIACP